MPVPVSIPASLPKSDPLALLDQLNADVVGCTSCDRLRSYCTQIGSVKRRAYLDWEYWAKPVPSFGDPQATVLVVGLAPGAHGSNRTGRPFTGDGSGAFLYPTLYEAGYASQSSSLAREDGMTLAGLRITAAVRCAPPDNKPLPSEIQNCARFLDQEIAALAQLRVIVCLGKIAFDSVTAHLVRTGQLGRRHGWKFAHGSEFRVGPPGAASAGLGSESRGLAILASYHPSLQNTNTGRLTRPMFFEIFRRARLIANASVPGAVAPKSKVASRNHELKSEN